ncbi:LysR substrate-binding domain-containing protein [Porifericola rhodea]|uniref:LysR family transcriptional regulator n=1 Tax=Porifericola rhodea TaxID=930972 RepID=UPI00266585D6|nr:hydrogen peroxide-inducible genes activator [Porifericola rhodea]WKN30562.1 LysR substrate-binding domain-containing protein [Porifericola rhodea]
MNIQQLEYIEAVSELRSFDKAAEKCCITQSTLSTMVSRLEKELGIVFFDRKTKPITVTREGQELINQAQTILREINNFKELVSGLKGELRGSLKIGAIPTVASYLFPLFLKEFIEAHPKIHFTISEGVTEKIISDLESRKLDIGLLSTPLDHPNLIEVPLYQEPFILFDSARRKVTEQTDDVDLNKIDVNRLWLLEEGHCLRAQISKLCSLRKERSPDWNLEYKSGTIDTLKRFVKLNDGLTIFPQLATIDFSMEDRRHLRKFKKPVPAREVSLVVHKHFVKKKILNELKNVITDTVSPLISKEKKVQLVSPV